MPPKPAGSGRVTSSPGAEVHPSRAWWERRPTGNLGGTLSLHLPQESSSLSPPADSGLELPR